MITKSMEYSKKAGNENEEKPSLPSSFKLPLLSHKFETVGKSVSILDVNLCDLKRAYGVPLETQESVDCSEVRDFVNNDHEEEEKGDWSNGHHPMKFCESQINDEEDVSLQIGGHEYKCCYCYFEGNILQLRNHTKYCHPGELVKSNWCSHCRVNFENETVFRQHQTQEHAFYCLQCKKSFRRRRLLLAHLPIHSEEKCFKCPTCEKVFPVHRYLVRHLERHEKNLEVKEEPDECMFTCTECQKGFSKKESLVKHTRIHTRDSLKCSLCDFTCGRKVTLKMHFISHEGNRKYKCSHCDFSFKQIGHLKRHITRFNH